MKNTTPILASYNSVTERYLNEYLIGFNIVYNTNLLVNSLKKLHRKQFKKSIPNLISKQGFSART